jgi:hypothetical protein
MPIVEGRAEFPASTFVTHSSDGSVRFWSMHPNRAPGRHSLGGKELLQVFYVDPEWRFNAFKKEPGK